MVVEQVANPRAAFYCMQAIIAPRPTEPPADSGLPGYLLLLWRLRGRAGARNSSVGVSLCACVCGVRTCRSSGRSSPRPRPTRQRACVHVMLMRHRGSGSGSGRYRSFYAAEGYTTTVFYVQQLWPARLGPLSLAREASAGPTRAPYQECTQVTMD